MSESSHRRLRKLLTFPTFSLPATFQIIKKLLPKKAVERLKFISAKNVDEYIDEANTPASWGGRDSYEFSFVPESRQSDEAKHENGTLHQPANNNDAEQANLNLTQRKVSPVISSENSSEA